MRRFSKWIGVIVICLCITGLSFTAQAAGNDYFVLKGGIYSPQSKELGDFSTGFNGEIAYGHYYNSNWAVEFGTGYFATKANQEANYPFRASADLDLKTIPLTVSLKGIIPVDKFEFYGLGGIGAYFTFADVDINYTGNRHVSYSDNNALFGGFLGLGAQYNFTPKVFVGVEGKYLWTTKTTFRDTDAEVDLGGIQATVNLGYRF
jgi:opacity protein-like surface antigen